MQKDLFFTILLTTFTLNHTVIMNEREQNRIRNKIKAIDLVKGNFGWKLIGMDELTYMSYPEENRKGIECMFTIGIEQSLDLMLIVDQMKAYLTDNVYWWLCNKNDKDFLKKELRNNLLKDRLDELKIEWELAQVQENKKEKYTIIETSENGNQINK